MTRSFPALIDTHAKRVTAGVLAWLAFQALLPLRHYVIPGDARVTFEGLSFSWRLKAEVYRSDLCSLFVDNPGVIQRDGAGCTKLDWSSWHGDRAVYRTAATPPIPWKDAPEILVLLGPLTGERIIYNPQAGRDQARDDAESRRRIQEIWQSHYSRPPTSIRRTIPTGSLLESFATALRGKGHPIHQPGDVMRTLSETRRKDGFVPLLTPLRWVQPFGFSQAGAAAGAYYLIEDAALTESTTERGPRIRREAWKLGEHTRPSRPDAHPCVTPEPLVIRIEGDLRDLGPMLPRSYLCDSEQQPKQPVRIAWDYLKDMPLSKGMHISTNPFLLRRYAQRVARLWQDEYGRIPAVRATTGISVNFRPLQKLVDPTVDLASVPSSWWWHDPWVNDLEAARIPR